MTADRSPTAGSPGDRPSPDAGLGARIRALRQRRGLSLRELARRLGVSPATLSQLERDRVGLTVARLTAIAHAIGVRVADLVGGSPGGSTGTHATGAESSGRTDEVGEGPDQVASADGTGGGDWRSFPPMRLSPVLAAALDAFLELGYAGASVRDIARRCDLSVPGLYHHYASKQDMLADLLRRYLESLLERTEQARAEGGDDPVERFARIVECLVLHHTHRRALALVGLTEIRNLEPANRERIRQLLVRQQRMVDAEVEAAHRLGRFTTPYPRDASRAVVTMCTAIPHWYREDGPDPPEVIARRYVRMALDLMGCVPPRP